jgi:hypothetical protein
MSAGFIGFSLLRGQRGRSAAGLSFAVNVIVYSKMWAGDQWPGLKEIWSVAKGTCFCVRLCASGDSIRGVVLVATSLTVSLVNEIS